MDEVIQGRSKKEKIGPAPGRAAISRTAVASMAQHANTPMICLSQMEMRYIILEDDHLNLRRLPSNNKLEWTTMHGADSSKFRLLGTIREQWNSFGVVALPS